MSLLGRPCRRFNFACANISRCFNGQSISSDLHFPLQRSSGIDVAASSHSCWTAQATSTHAAHSGGSSSGLVARHSDVVIWTCGIIDPTPTVGSRCLVISGSLSLATASVAVSPSPDEYSCRGLRRRQLLCKIHHSSMTISLAGRLRMDGRAE